MSLNFMTAVTIHSDFGDFHNLPWDEKRNVVCAFLGNECDLLSSLRVSLTQGETNKDSY